MVFEPPISMHLYLRIKPIIIYYVAQINLALFFLIWEELGDD